MALKTKPFKLLNLKGFKMCGDMYSGNQTTESDHNDIFIFSEPAMFVFCRRHEPLYNKALRPAENRQY